MVMAMGHNMVMHCHRLDRHICLFTPFFSPFAAYVNPPSEPSSVYSSQTAYENGLPTSSDWQEETESNIEAKMAEVKALLASSVKNKLPWKQRLQVVSLLSIWANGHT